jgi:hypothetical protein
MVSSEGPDRPVSKQIRLSLACNPCRKRKVRCDARQPKCRNCSLRGDVCETSDLRKPGKTPGVRRRATAKQGRQRYHAEPTDQSPTTETTAQSALTPVSRTSKPHVSPYDPPTNCHDGGDSPRALDDAQDGAEMSWVARGYMAASKPLPDASVVTPDAVVHTDKTSHSPRFKVRRAIVCGPHCAKLIEP